MTDMTSPVAPDEPSGGAPEQAPASQPEPQSSPVAEGEPREPERKPVNLQDFPEFQAMQARDRQLQAIQQHNQEMARQLRELQTRNMSQEEYQGFEFQEQQRRLQEEAQSLQAEREKLVEEKARMRIARDLNVPFDVFADADNPDDAWLLASKHRITELEAQIEALKRDTVSRAPANTPDLGKPVGEKSATRDFGSAKWDTNDGLRDFYRQVQEEMDLES